MAQARHFEAREWSMCSEARQQWKEQDRLHQQAKRLELEQSKSPGTRSPNATGRRSASEKLSSSAAGGNGEESKERPEAPDR